MLTELFGGRMEDIWTTIQFDAAVSLFGVWIDNKLKEYDIEAKRHKHTLDELLGEHDKPMSLAQIRAGLGKLPGLTIKKVVQNGGQPDTG